MKTKLLKIIRSDKRFIIEHKFYTPGFRYSGWWYLTDTGLNKMVRHKRLTNIVNEYVKMYRLRLRFKWIFRVILFAILYISFNALISCQPERVEVWPVPEVKHEENDTIFIIQHLLDSIQNQ